MFLLYYVVIKEKQLKEIRLQFRWIYTLQELRTEG